MTLVSRYSERQISISRSLSVLLALLTILAAGVVFEEKREAGRIASEVSRLSSKIAEEKERISELKAEWSLLEQPGRLQAIVEQHAARFSLAPIRTDQIGAIADAPFRPVAAPSADPAAPPPAVAASTSAHRPAAVEAPFVESDVPPGAAEGGAPTIDTLLRRPVGAPDPETTGSLPSPVPGPGPLATQPASEPPPVLRERPAAPPRPAAPAPKAAAPAAVPSSPVPSSPVPSPAATAAAVPPPAPAAPSAVAPPAAAAPRGPALRASGPIATGGPMSLSFER